MIRSPNKYVLLLSMIVCLVAGTAWAQRTTGSIGGTVMDESGAVLPGVDITVISEGTGVVRNTLSNEAGVFVVPGLIPGTYTLAIEMPGFRRFEQTTITVESARDIRDNYTMQVGAVSETITVTGGQTLVSTVASEQRSGLTNTQLAELPNANRNISNILSLSPAVTLMRQDPDNRAVSLNGMGGQSTSYTMDGVEASGQADGRQLAQYQGQNKVDLLSTDAIQEVQIIKGVVPAEYANTVSGQVNIITKSGGSEVHGTVFHLYQGAFGNAQNPFLSSKPNIVYNQFGASVGFPIVQDTGGIVDSAFGFFAYEGYEERRNLSRNQDVPTALARSVLRSSPNYDSRELQILDLMLDNTPEPNLPGTIDDDTCSACGGQRGLGGEYRIARLQDSNDDVFLFKNNLNFSDGSAFAFTFSRLSPISTRPGINKIEDRFWEDFNNRYAGTWFKSSGFWTLEGRMGYTWIQQARNENNFDQLFDPTRGTVELGFGDNRIPTISPPQFSTTQGEIRAVWSPTWTADFKVGYIKGNHNLKWGVSYRTRGGSASNTEMPVHSYDSCDPSIAFCGTADATGFENLYANLPPDQARMSYGQPHHDKSVTTYGLFFQDDFKVRPNFTLNLGLRWDAQTAVPIGVSKNSRFPTGSAQSVIYFNLTPPTDWNLFDFGDLLFSGANHRDIVNFGPRLGFNWDTSGEGRTVVRGGFGMLYAPTTSAVHADQAADRFVPRRTNFNAVDGARFGIRMGTLNGDTRAATITLAKEQGDDAIAFALINPFYEMPYTMTWSLGVQREVVQDAVLEIDYVGQRGVKLPMTRAPNEAAYGTGVRPNPTLLSNFYADNSAQAFYNALQVAFNKRFTSNLAYGISYAYSRALAVGGSDIGARFGGDNFECCQEFSRPDLARGRSPSSIEHNFTANGYYSLPSPEGAAGVVLGGWSLSGILRMQTGAPTAVRDRDGSRRRQMADIVVSDHEQARFENTFRDDLQFWNPAAFAQVPFTNNVPIRPGNASRALLSGPGFSTMDLSFGKNFRINEDARLQFRWDLLNAFNHVNYGNPRSRIDRSGFGEIRSANSMRVSQLNLKLFF